MLIVAVLLVCASMVAIPITKFFRDVKREPASGRTSRVFDGHVQYLAPPRRETARQQPVAAASIAEPETDETAAAEAVVPIDMPPASPIRAHRRISRVELRRAFQLQILLQRRNGGEEAT